MKTILAFMLIAYVSFVHPLCAITGAPTGQPPKRNSRPTPPVIYDDPIDACPYYTGKPVCCNKDQQASMCIIFPCSNFSNSQRTKEHRHIVRN